VFRFFFSKPPEKKPGLFPPSRNLFDPRSPLKQFFTLPRFLSPQYEEQRQGSSPLARHCCSALSTCGRRRRLLFPKCHEQIKDGKHVLLPFPFSRWKTEGIPFPPPNFASRRTFFFLFSPLCSGNESFAGNIPPPPPFFFPPPRFSALNFLFHRFNLFAQPPPFSFPGFAPFSLAERPPTFFSEVF